MSYYTGILLLQDNNCYGLTKSSNPSELYIFRSFDSKVSGLVPTKISKHTKRNQFVTVKKVDNIENDERIEYIVHIHHGSVDDPQAFLKAICFQHNISVKNTYYKNMPINPIEFPNKNNNKFMYTVDPDGCKDIDDAISINFDDNKNIQSIGIHITYIGHIMINYLNKMDKSCTIYPSGLNNIHMLPKKYATDDFSLLQQKWRNVLSLYLYPNCISKWKFEQIKVNKNLSYKQGDRIFHKYINNINSILDTFYYNTRFDIYSNNMKTIIEKSAIIYNSLAGSHLYHNKYNPIIRTHKHINNTIFGESLYNYASENTYHQSLQIHYYSHITSPIRRITDIYNQYLMYLSIQNKDEPIKYKLDINHLNHSIICAKRIMSYIERYQYFNTEIPKYVAAEIIIKEQSTICIKFRIYNIDKYLYIPMLPYYMKTFWHINDKYQYQHNINNQIYDIKPGQNICFKVIKDMNPYPRVMFVPDFLFPEKDNNNIIKNIEIIEDDDFP